MHRILEIIKRIEHKPSNVGASIHILKDYRLPQLSTRMSLLVILEGELQTDTVRFRKITAGQFLLTSNICNTLKPKLLKPNISRKILLINFELIENLGICTRDDPSFECKYGSVYELLDICLAQYLDLAIMFPNLGVLHLRQEELIKLCFDVDKSSNHHLSDGTAAMSGRVLKLIAKKLDFSQCCTTLGTSESTLRRKLHQEGTSYKALKSKWQLNKGYDLICNSQKPIYLVALECGFKSQSRFTANFKTIFGATPSEIRESMKVRKQINKASEQI